MIEYDAHNRMDHLFDIKGSMVREIIGRVLLYCATLPFALIDPFGWYTVLDILLIAYIFFGIEEIGVEIEDPFGMDDNDLPLETICRTIENNLLATLEPAKSLTIPAEIRR